jgi:Cysteine-rich secretory protein family
MRKRRGLLAVMCAVFCMTFGLQMRAHAQSKFSDQAQHIFELTNHDREARGLQPLRWDTSLAAAAQEHAERMAGENYLSHEYPGEGDVGMRAAQAGAHFQAIAENIAMGYSDDAIEAEWMNSTPHRRNILDPQMNAIGVGVVARRGNFFAVEDFANASVALSPEQVEHRIDDLLRNEGIDPTAPHEAAAQACLSNSGYPRGGTGRLVIRFDTPALNELPSAVEVPVRSGAYSRASVAACPGGGRQGSFTTYRVAIVLY